MREERITQQKEIIQVIKSEINLTTDKERVFFTGISCRSPISGRHNALLSLK